MSYQDLSRADRKRWRRSLMVRCHLGRPVGHLLDTPQMFPGETIREFKRIQPSGRAVYTMLSTRGR